MNQCKLQVLGEKSTEVTLISNTCSTIYSGFEHNVFAKCNNFEAERILRPGVTKVTLLNANKCTFQSNFYLFTLSGHENAKDTLYHQNIPQIIKDFSNYSIGLDVLEDMGLSRNFTKDLNDIQNEIESIKVKDSYQRFASVSSGISCLIAIIITILFIAATFWIWRYLKAKRNAKLRQNLRKTESAKTENENI